MKTLFTFAFACLTSALVSQSFSVYKTNNTGINTATITNGGTLNETTSASSLLYTKIKIKNNAANTQTFTVKRSVLYNSPALILDGSSSTPSTYFCFGNTCFPSNINAADPANYTILAAAGQTNVNAPTSDNTATNGQPFSIYLDEAATIGNYVIRYKISNVNNPNDTLAFTVVYNQGVGIKKNTNSSDFISSVFPNPASGESTLNAHSSINQQAGLFIYNSLGELVKTNKFNLVAGTNDLKFSCSDLSAGVYNLILTTEQGSLIKKLTVSK
ncbi:MAG: hypothetical protein JWO32_1962 [Bacteroidetes bacterium]|nr:hypothetical protein [Bacteroidota bacterium]